MPPAKKYNIQFTTEALELIRKLEYQLLWGKPMVKKTRRKMKKK